MTRVLITGSRYWTDVEKMRVTFREWVRETRPVNPTLISGAAKGADTLGADLWKMAGFLVEFHPAKWDEHGGCWCKDLSKRCGFAGFRRNLEMIESGADICFAFLQSGEANKGTKHCATNAAKVGIPVVEVWSD